MPSRRNVLAGISGGLGLLAGCLGAETPIARCSSQGQRSESQHLRTVAPITGEKRVALGVVVSNEVPQQDRFDAITVRNRDGALVASVPLENNREMNRLDPDDHDVFGSDSGELYAIPLGVPPVHRDFDVALVDPTGQELAAAEIKFNCYAASGTLP